MVRTKFILITAVVFLLALGARVDGETRPAKELLADSYAQEAVKDYASASVSVRHAVAQNPDDRFLNLRLGWLYYLDGKFDQSVAVYKKVLNWYPHDLDAHSGLTLALSAAGRWREAEKIGSQAAQDFPQNYYTLVRLGDIYLHLDDPENARDCYLRAFNLYPADPDVNLGLGWSYFYLGEKAAAEKCFRFVLDRAPDNQSAQQGLAALNKDYSADCYLGGTFLVYQGNAQKQNMSSLSVIPALNFGRLTISPGYIYTEIISRDARAQVRQNEAILGLTYRFSRGLTVNGFVDLINNNDPQTNRGRVAAGEVLYTRKHAFYFGLGGAYSLYNNIAVTQFTPRLGWGITPGLWNEVKYDGIALSGSASPAQGNSAAWQDKLTFYPNPRFNFSLVKWIGRKYFPVDIDAKMVYDFPDRLTGGASFIFSYIFDKGGALSGSVTREDLETSAGDPYNYLSVICGYNFSW